MNVMRAVREVRPEVTGLSDAERGHLEHRLFGDVAPAKETAVGPADHGQAPSPRSWMRLATAAAAVLLVGVGVWALVIVDRGQDPAASSVPATDPMANEAPPPDPLIAAMRAALDHLPTVDASVIGVAPNSTIIEIDRGAAHGLAVGMPVVDATGVVGKITQVSDESSIVMLVVDDDYAVQVRAEYGGSASFDALAVGDGVDQLEIATPDRPDPYTPGALVVTQGGSTSLAPPGLPVGTLTTGNGPDAEPRVQPSANLDDLDDVHVVLFRPLNDSD